MKDDKEFQKLLKNSTDDIANKLEIAYRLGRISALEEVQSYQTAQENKYER